MTPDSDKPGSAGASRESKQASPSPSGNNRHDNSRCAVTIPFDETPLPHQVAIASCLRSAREVEDEIIYQVQQLGYSEQAVFAIRLAMEEAMVNAHKHGNQCDENKKLVVSYDIDKKRVLVRVRDQGCGFDPENVPDPTHPERIPLPCGRGLMLMRTYLDGISFNEKGNEVQLMKVNN
jgi:serine/threonine-protein kinase RsbW